MKENLKEGRKSLIYITLTGRRDIRERIVDILKRERINAGILSETVPPKKREQWIEANAEKFDALIVNPELVKLGLDLYQFPTVIFFQTGYNIFTLRQAARRSWRIGQRYPVKVYFLCYQETMQEVAISLIAKKLEASLLVEGELPEGLAQYTIEGSSMVEDMLKALMGKNNTQGIGAEQAWAMMRKKEIEAQLGIGKNETIFSEAGKRARIGKPVTKTTVIDDVTIKVTILNKRGRRQSTLTVKKSEMDKELAGKVVQFNLF